MNTVIVLAMHGSPPNDFPRQDMGEFFALRTRLDHYTGPDRAVLEQRHAELEAKMRAWPRTAKNDPFFAGAQELAAELKVASGHEVVIAFGEFCAPDLDEALDQAAAMDPDRVVMATPMMTRGGEHSEVDIAEAVRRARERHPRLSFVYAWPFEVSEIARFLASQIGRFLSNPA